MYLDNIIKEGVFHMKTEEDKAKEQGKISNRYQAMGMSIGMCFGVSIGLAFGNLFSDHGTIGMCLGLSIGMMLGMIAGSAKDKKVNEQLAEIGYRITAINMIGEDKYEITVSDKNDNVKKVEIYHGDMKVEQFKIGDFVYIDEDGNMESVMDKDGDK